MYGSENLLSGLVYFYSIKEVQSTILCTIHNEKKKHYSGKIKKKTKINTFSRFY